MNENNQIISITKSFFHSFSQVVLLENILSGMLILFAIIVFDYKLAILACLSVILGNIFAYVLTQDRESIISGLYGFCPLLVGIASGVFFSGFECYIAACIGSLLCIPLTIVINKICSRFLLPGFTFPFILMTWFLILLSFSGNLLTTGQTPQLAEHIIHSNDSLVFPDIIFKGIGEIFLLDSTISSLLILLAFVIVSWKLALSIMVTIALTLLLGYVFKVDFNTLSLGLISYNSILTFMGIETFSVSEGIKKYGLIILGIIYTVLIDMAAPTVLGVFGLPSLTFPFVLVTWIILYLEKQLPFNTDIEIV